MKKGDLFSSGSGYGFFMDQTTTGVLCLLQLAFQVVTLIGDMVNTLASFFQKLCNRAVRSRWFQEFNMGFAQGKKGGSHLLTSDLLDPAAGKSQAIFIKRACRIYRMNGDSYMVNFF